MKRSVLPSILMALFVAVAVPAVAKDKNKEELAKAFKVPIDKVYAAVVQVASTRYNLKSAIKEAYTVNFFTGGAYSWVGSAVCHDSGNGQAMVALSLAESQGNPLLFGVGREREKVAKRFWAELDLVLAVNEKIDTNNSPAQPSDNSTVTELPTEVAIRSSPEGADIAVDGKFFGNTPSTLHLSAGDHSISIAYKGFKKWQRTVTLSGGGTISLNAILEAESPSSD